MRGVRIFSVFAAFAVLALVASGCGDENKSKSSSKSSGAASQQRVKTALANIQKINSGAMKIDATISGGPMPGSLKVTGGGKFDLKAAGGAAFEIEVSLDIAGQAQKMGFVAVDGKSYMTFGGRAFSLGDEKSGGTSATGQFGAIKPDQIRDMINSLDAYLNDFEETGTAQVDGDSVTVYSAKANTKELSSKVQKEAGGKLPSVPGLGDFSALTSMFGDIVVSIGIDDDGLLRRVALETSVGATAEGADTAGAMASSTIKASVELADVNDPVTVEAPKNVTEGAGALEALGGMFGGMGSAMGDGATGTMGGPSDGK